MASEFTSSTTQDRRRTRAVVFGGSILAFALVCVVAFSIIWLVRGHATNQATGSAEIGVSGDEEDAIALKEFPTVPEFSFTAKPPRVSQPPAPWTISGSAAEQSSEGAILSLHKAVGTAMNGLDPKVAETAVEAFVLPGQGLTNFDDWIEELHEVRKAAQLPLSGEIEGLSSSVDLTGALDRGSTRNGLFRAVCIHEELWASYTSWQTMIPVVVCARMWWNGSEWKGEPGVTAAPTTVWANTQPFFDVGFKPVELRG